MALNWFKLVAKCDLFAVNCVPQLRECFISQPFYHLIDVYVMVIDEMQQLNQYLLSVL